VQRLLIALERQYVIRLPVTVNKSPSLARRLGWTLSTIDHDLEGVQRWRRRRGTSVSSFGGIVEGGSKWRRGAAEFGGAGWVKVSVGQDWCVAVVA
jgi:hypothetical protein